MIICYITDLNHSNSSQDKYSVEKTHSTVRKKFKYAPNSFMAFSFILPTFLLRQLWVMAYQVFLNVD